MSKISRIDVTYAGEGGGGVMTVRDFEDAEIRPGDVMVLQVRRRNGVRQDLLVFSGATFEKPRVKGRKLPVGDNGVPTVVDEG